LSFSKKYGEEYFRQLTAEKVVTKYRRGFKRREWVLMRPRNEALDCRVYALSAFTILNADLNRISEKHGFDLEGYTKHEEDMEYSSNNLTTSSIDINS
jgi:phage terminase large subunit GpA-like protein